MTDYFEWRADDDDGWDSPVAAEDPESNSRSTDRLLTGLLIATVVALILLVVIPTGQGISRAVDAATSGAQADLLAANQLVLKAALNGDVELHSQLLSRQDMQWHSDQRVIVRRQLFHDRAPLAIWLDRPALAASEAPFLDADVALSPDLSSADVTTTLPYLALTDGGGLESIRLDRTLHYRQVADRWILVPAAGENPPLEESELVYEGEILRLRYPEHDQEVGRRLGQEIDAILQQLCQQSAALSCAPGSNFDAQLSSDSSSLLGLDRAFLQPRYRTYWARSIGSSRDIILPGPGVVGAPSDETGYQALFRGYASWLATAFIHRQIDPSTMPNENYLALLSGVELIPPPPAEHNPLLAREVLPIPLPEQKIQLRCTYNPQGSEWWLYDPAADIWSDEPVAEPSSLAGPETSSRPGESRNGRLIVVERQDETTIELRHRDGRLLRRLTGAENPFWLDDHTLVYQRVRRLPAEVQPAGATRPVTESDLAVMTLDQAGQPADERLLTSSQLREAVNLYPKPQGLQITDVIAQPQSAGRMFILARAASGLHDVYLFAVDRQLTTIDFLDRWRDNGSSDLPLHITADGRFLTITRYSYSRTYLSIYDVARRSRQMITVAGRPVDRFDWSADQQWLVVAADRLLWLVAPAFGYASTIPHNIAGCWSAAWVPSGDA